MASPIICRLNTKWKSMLLVTGYASLAMGILLIFLTIFGTLKVDGDVIVVIVIISFFILGGAELLYEGTQSRVEITDTEITYYQPRFVLSCKWSDLQNVLLIPAGEVLLFSKAKILKGRFFSQTLKTSGPWDRSIPFNCYLSKENIDSVQNITKNYSDQLPEDGKFILGRLFDLVRGS
jgi:hypothetical protein